MKVQLNDIRHPSTWGGKEPANHSPSFDYCRKLIAEGYDPNEPLEIYRGEKLAYTIKTKGLGATKKIREDNLHSAHEIDYKLMDEKTKARLASRRAGKATGADRTCV